MELLGEGGKEDGEGHGQAAHHCRQPGRLPSAKVDDVQPGFKMYTKITLSCGLLDFERENSCVLGGVMIQL